MHLVHESKIITKILLNENKCSLPTPPTGINWHFSDTSWPHTKTRFFNLGLSLHLYYVKTALAKTAVTSLVIVQKKSFKPVNNNNNKQPHERP